MTELQSKRAAATKEGASHRARATELKAQAETLAREAKMRGN